MIGIRWNIGHEVKTRVVALRQVSPTLFLPPPRGRRALYLGLTRPGHRSAGSKAIQMTLADCDDGYYDACQLTGLQFALLGKWVSDASAYFSSLSLVLGERRSLTRAERLGRRTDLARRDPAHGGRRSDGRHRAHSVRARPRAAEEISLESPTASIAVAITAMKHKLSTYREAAEMKPAIVMANCPL